MKILNIRFYQLRLDFFEQVKISFNTWIRTDNILVIVDTDTGLIGCGEAAPFKSITGDSHDDSLRYLRSAAKPLIGEDPSNLDRIHSILDEVSRDLGWSSSTALAAIDSACYDVFGRGLQKPIYQLLGSKEPRPVPNSVTIYLGTAEDAAEKARRILARYKQGGLSLIKLKLSGDPKLDLARTLSVAEVHLGKLTLDANQAYPNPDLAIELIDKIYDKLGSRVLLVEEPCPKGDLTRLKHVTDNSRIPIFADESAATLEDVRRVVESRAANGINLKLQKIGGIHRGLKAARLADAKKVDIMVGCMMESGVGISCGAHFASALENAAYTDLDTDLMLRNDIITEDSRSVLTQGSRIPSSRPGLGINLNGSATDPIHMIS